MADAVSSGNRPIPFKVLTLNVTICILRLHLSNFCFSLSFATDFSNTEARAPTLAGRAPFLPARRAMWFGHKYALTLRNKFDALQEKSETHTPNDEYGNFVNSHFEEAPDVGHGNLLMAVFYSHL